jgi:peptidyl-prolyl cis-trans isomerase C
MQVRASHILVKTEQEANVVYYDVTHGKTFEEVAIAQSLCPSKKKGGDLGFFGRGQMVKEFETAAFSMKKGEVSKPIKTQFGWHILKLTDTQ